MRCKHQHLCFKNSSMSQRNVYSHLVTIKVSIECCTYQRVQLNCFTFNKLRLECLDTEPVQGRSTVEENRMSLQHVFKNIPNEWIFSVYNFLRALYSLYNTTLNHLADDKWFEEFCSHVFRKTTLMKFHIRTYHNYGTCRIVNTFTEEVLTEATLFSFQ